MFAGIVRCKGSIRGVARRDGDCELTIGFDPASMPVLEPGASVAVNGVCLTATECRPGAFTADVSGETLRVTTLGGLGQGDSVNLESSLRLGDAIDGHLVYGHVDGVGRVRSVKGDARSLRIAVDIPEALHRYVAVKGSIAVDGVSLTVNEVDRAGFAVNIIPHTRDATIIAGYRSGTTVNIEVDMMARYLERLASFGTQSEKTGIDTELLQQHGFASIE